VVQNQVIQVQQKNRATQVFQIPIVGQNRVIQESSSSSTLNSDNGSDPKKAFQFFESKFTNRFSSDEFSCWFKEPGNTCWLNAAIQGLKWCGFLDSLPSTDPSSFSTILNWILIHQDLLKEFQSDP